MATVPLMPDAAEDAQLREVPLSDEVVFPGALIRVNHMQVRLPDGRQALREVVHHGGAAAVVPVDENGRVTLVRQHRVAVDLMTLEIPAGKLDYVGEEPQACARRELEEEAGLTAGKLELLCPMVTTPGFCTERVSIYLATALTPSRSHLDADEFLHVVRMPLSEAVQLAANGGLCDGKTALGLMLAWARLHGLASETA